MILAACGRSGPYGLPPDAGQASDSGAVEVDAGTDAGTPDGGCTPRTFADACVAVKGATFASLVKGECGLCAPGYDCRCTWHLYFLGANSWKWQHSDYSESGSYACNGFELTGKSFNQVYAARYDPVCDRLTWDGVVYGREP